MLNKIEIEGKVLSAWIANKGGLIVKFETKYPHRFGDTVVPANPSVFRAIFNDLKRIPTIDVMAGDKVRITGHLHINHTMTHETLQLYADDIEVVSFAKA